MWTDVTKDQTHFQTKNSEMFLFLAVVLHMGHNIHNRLRDCWTRAKQFFTPFLPHYHFLHILRYWHFAFNEKEIDRNDENYYRLWKIREIFYVLHVAFSEFYNPC